MSGNFFKAVVQQVILFGAETWVVSPRMERALSTFIHMAARQKTVGKWFYPSLEGAMKEAGLTKVQKRSRSNILCNRVLTSVY